MSRTYRHLPWNGGARLKRYATCHHFTKPRYDWRSLYVYSPWSRDYYTRELNELRYDYSTKARLIELGVDANAYEIVIDERGWKHIRFLRIVEILEDDAELVKSYEAEKLQYCRKNKTCRRQRKNAVRLEKRYDKHRLRGIQKCELRAVLAEWHVRGEGSLTEFDDFETQRAAIQGGSRCARRV